MKKIYYIHRLKYSLKNRLKEDDVEKNMKRFIYKVVCFSNKTTTHSTTAVYITHTQTHHIADCFTTSREDARIHKCGHTKVGQNKQKYNAIVYWHSDGKLL